MLGLTVVAETALTFTSNSNSVNKTTDVVAQKISFAESNKLDTIDKPINSSQLCGIIEIPLTTVYNDNEIIINSQQRFQELLDASNPKRDRHPYELPPADQSSNMCEAVSSDSDDISTPKKRKQRNIEFKKVAKRRSSRIAEVTSTVADPVTVIEQPLIIAEVTASADQLAINTIELEERVNKRVASRFISRGLNVGVLYSHQEGCHGDSVVAMSIRKLAKYWGMTLNNTRKRKLKNMYDERTKKLSKEFKEFDSDLHEDIKL